MIHSNKREQLLKTALRLFETQCFHSTGVDQIAQEAGTTKRTLYQQFGSKEGLICEVLEFKRQQFADDLSKRLASAQRTGESELQTCVDFYLDWIQSAEYLGCLHVKALGEFAGSCSAITQKASAAKSLSRIACRSRKQGAPI